MCFESLMLPVSCTYLAMLWYFEFFVVMDVFLLEVFSTFNGEAGTFF